uniref:Uncharacterized protein n=1 Tax=Rhizophora mucronata TaxID=61149 RepID=A0A2P2M7J0_RHIMU
MMFSTISFILLLKVPLLLTFLTSLLFKLFSIRVAFTRPFVFLFPSFLAFLFCLLFSISLSTG